MAAFAVFLDHLEMRPLSLGRRLSGHLLRVLLAGTGLTAVVATTHCSKNIVTGSDVCADNQFRCDGNELKRCNANRSGYDPAEPCNASSHCDALAGKCLPGPAPNVDGGGKTCVFDDPSSKFDDCTFGP
jgi:hypothetical protein